MTEEEFRRITRAQDTEKQVEALNRLAVRAGEVHLVPAGTPHAIGSGVFVVEVQEPTDYLVNVEYTLGAIRRTEAQCFMGLGFDLGIQCFDCRAMGMDFVRRTPWCRASSTRTIRAAKKSSSGRRIRPALARCGSGCGGTVPDRDRGRCYVGIVIEGQGQLLGPDITMPLQPGATFFTPAASQHGVYQAAPGFLLTVIRCFPPAA